MARRPPSFPRISPRVKNRISTVCSLKSTSKLTIYEEPESLLSFGDKSFLFIAGTESITFLKSSFFYSTSSYAMATPRIRLVAIFSISKTLSGSALTLVGLVVSSNMTKPLVLITVEVFG